MCEGDWLSAQWVEPDKHRPPPAHIAWDEIRRRTAEGHKESKYHNKLTLACVETIEMSHGVSQRIVIQGRQYQTESDLLVTHSTVKKFFVRVLALIIGASLGEDTSIVLVYRAKSGAVHGHPISETELDQKKRKFGYVAR